MLRLYCLLIAIFTSFSSLYGQIRLPRLISDGVVLQRNTEIKIWGWAAPGERVELVLDNQKFSATTDSDGEWHLYLPPREAGGPYEMVFEGSNIVKIEDVLFGDVWVCSGQSNMELPMERVKELYSKEIKSATNRQIRYFKIDTRYDFKSERADLESGTWQKADPLSVLDFSAVGYFFARYLQAQTNVPIGLISAAVGGSPVEAWMSSDALTDFPDILAEAERFQNDSLIDAIEKEDQLRADKWYKKLNANDPGLKKWHAADFNDSEWEELILPGLIAKDASDTINGVWWFRKQVLIPKSMTGKSGKLWLGRIIDADSAFINGKFAGTTSYQYPPRRYQFADDLLIEGLNQISVRVINSKGQGGFIPDKPYFIAVGKDTINLSGTWKYRQAYKMPPLDDPTFIRWKPTGLFNAMIAPLLNFSISGVIWYQGESNTKNPEQYKALFPAQIRNWRNRWQQDFPFIYVQLANFMDPALQPTESAWAMVRQAQLETLTVGNTGMAVAIDIGEWNDIHPLRKEEVGYRLSLWARHLKYKEHALVCSGPIYKSHLLRDNKMEITFDHTGGGLVAKGGGDLMGFSIAGKDGVFRWAKAVIKADKVLVWHDEISRPVKVRYAWADNPHNANLYNTEGLPASPFGIE